MRRHGCPWGKLTAKIRKRVGVSNVHRVTGRVYVWVCAVAKHCDRRGLEFLRACAFEASEAGSGPRTRAVARGLGEGLSVSVSVSVSVRFGAGHGHGRGRAALSFLMSAPSARSAPAPSPRSSRSHHLLLQGVAQHLARAEL
eukprot:1739225-Prymnesium_polylepis.1